jgi:uncharacterized membrane protein
VSRRWWQVDPIGSALGLVLAGLSITPSLLPRPALLQGAVAALAFGLGYLVGTSVSVLVRSRVTWRPSPATLRRWWIGYGLAWLVALAGLSSASLVWQNEVRRSVEMPPLPGSSLVGFLSGFLPLAVLLLAAGKGVRRIFGFLRRRRGRLVGALGGLASVVIVLGLLVGGGLAAVDSIYAARNGRPDAEAIEPSSAYRSAGAGSAIAWEGVGRHGGNFLAGGPTAAEISEVTGAAAIEPIRVYAGLGSAGTLAERARLAVAELQRTGAFDRDVLVVATTTGSGWLEAQTMDALEYLHGGNTAIAALQYAYTPSWVSFLFNPDAPVAAAEELFDQVYAVWSELPADARPQLISYGLSLGAHGSQAVFSDVADLRSRADGAMFVGSPNGSPLWRSLQAARDPGSPAWQPVLDGGREVRWISRPGDELFGGEWTRPRVLYLQHATDPVTWLGPDLLGVTAAQITVDMLMGEAVPAHHGHNYGNVVTAGWRAVTGDAGLDDAAVARVEAVIAEYADIRPFGE